MPSRRLIVCLALALPAAPLPAQTRPAQTRPATTAPATQPADPATPAGRWIARGRRMVAQAPGKAAGYNVEALGLSHRARETGDPAYYDRAAAVLDRSFEVEPDNFEGQKVRAWILLGQHRFREARDLAAKLNQRMPDDLYAYAFLTDANVALGDYDAAEKAAQILLDLRPNSAPALTRGALLRELFGDPDGATEFYAKAYQITPADEGEERAWTLTQIARIYRNRGKFKETEQTAEAALREFPDYAPALTVLADSKQARARELDRRAERVARGRERGRGAAAAGGRP